ncbi:MAG: L-threonylcarbamoyladenylate synthase, partial [Acidimicrobiia bacterium]|nr:L-threonylcarbamoyladenylate synthase [Acidimicrobiia bacterium]
DAGRPVVVPTDTVYGLAARADDHRAVDTIFEWKVRPADQVLAVLVASAEQAWSLGRPTPVAEALAATFWPGPLTLVLRQHPDTDLALGGPSSTVGVRWPDAAFVVALAERVGPLTATSANRHGEPTPARAGEVAAQLAQPDALVINGGVIDGEASTVVDATGPDPQVLRVGPVSASAIEAVFRRI